MAQRILSIILTVSMLFSVSGFVLAKERADVTLIGGQFGNLETVSVTDCAELDSAYELDLNKTPDAGGFGIELDTAQFNLEAGSVYVLSFYSKLEKTFDTLTVTTEDLNQNKITGFTYQLAGQWTKICFPFTATGNENSIKMILGGKIQKVYIGKIDVSLYEGEYNDAPGGYFMAESDEWETVEINKKDGLGVGSCMDVKAIGDYDKDYEFTVGSARKLIAIFAEKDGAYVTFKNINGFVMAEGLASDLTVPQDPYVYGYEFKGWYKAGEISSYKAGAKVTDEQSAQYVAGFGKKETAYKITINGEEKTYSYNDKVTVAEKDGKTFSYWTKDGKAASYDKEYSFFASADSVLEEVYGESAENKNVLVMANPVMADETRIAFFAERNISSENKIIETGILMGKADGLTLESTEAIKAVAKSKVQKGQFTVRKANVSAGETWYGRAYAIYRDSTGSAQTIYSNEVSKAVE